MLSWLMGGSAYRGSHFCLGKSKQNRVLRKTRVQGGILKSLVYTSFQQLNICLLTQTVAQDGLEAKQWAI
ncbi:MAG: hypothetical protein NVS3B3_11920 [Aquirhabdus sp.]